MKGFKEFLLRGNVVDLAVAVVIGTAFTAIVNSLVANIFNPAIGAARQAAARALSPAEREALWSSLGESTSATDDDYRRLDSRLHLTIGELAGSSSLVPLLAEVRMRVNELLDSIPSLGPNIAHSNRQHEQIVMAVLTGNPEAAAQAMAEHLAGTALLLRGFLE